MDWHKFHRAEKIEDHEGRRIMKLTKIMALAVLGLSLFGCGEKTADTNSINSSGGNAPAGSTASANSANNAGPVANVNSNANANANTTAVASPKRISFNKGANWAAVNITLSPGGSQKFVVGARAAQTMSVETSSKELSINLTRGKAETTEDFGFLNAELNANGDYIFEVRNGTKKEVKTSVKVTIEGHSKPVEEAVPADDDEPISPGE